MQLNEPPKERLEVSTDPSRLDMAMIIAFLQQTYWGKEFKAEDIRQAAGNSLSFGLYLNDTQIGFARAITDYTLFAWLADVFILPEHQGKGYGEFLIKAILDDPKLKHIRRWRLATKDAGEFYTRFDFSVVKNPERFMERIMPAK